MRSFTTADSYGLVDGIKTTLAIRRDNGPGGLQEDLETDRSAEILVSFGSEESRRKGRALNLDTAENGEPENFFDFPDAERYLYNSPMDFDAPRFAGRYDSGLPAVDKPSSSGDGEFIAFLGGTTSDAAFHNAYVIPAFPAPGEGSRIMRDFGLLGEFERRNLAWYEPLTLIGVVTLP